jgi:hypothetical protein
MNEATKRLLIACATACLLAGLYVCNNVVKNNRFRYVGGPGEGYKTIIDTRTGQLCYGGAKSELNPIDEMSAKRLDSSPTDSKSTRNPLGLPYCSRSGP